MISANELRVGNYVKRKDNILLFIGIMPPIIKLSNKGYPSDYVIDDDQLEYLSLTLAILKKCGFKEDIGGDIVLDINRELDLRYDKNSKSVTLWAHFDFSVITIKYLHQLQNLYFSLTENELQITL